MKSKDNYRKYFNIKNISEEFKDIYDKLKKENFEVLEKLRKKLIVKYIFEYTFLIFSVIMLVVILTRTEELGYNASDFTKYCAIGLFISVIIVVILHMFRKNNESKYKENYKEDVVSFFIRSIDPNFKYNFKRKEHEKMYTPYRPVTSTEREYKFADFDGKYFDYINEDDWIQREINNKEYFQITDMKAIREYKNSNGVSKEISIFEGLFFWIESKKDIKTSLKININKNNKVSDLKKIKIQMDSTEFENIFDIFCEDNVLAMRILTPDVMEMMLEFYRKYYIPFEMCYRNNRIYIRFFIKNLFEPKILGSSMDIKTIYIYYTILEFVFEFTKKVDKITEGMEI